MKQRLTRTLLVLLVLGVWGAVLARVLRPSPSAPPSRAVVQDQPDVAQEAWPDTLVDLHLVRDPFLDGNNVAPAVRRKSNAENGRDASHAPRPSTGSSTANKPWPTIVFKGSMGSPAKPDDRIAFLSIGGREVMLRANEEVQGMRLRQVHADSVVMERGGERRVFTR
jgi:hypothetical protein